MYFLTAVKARKSKMRVPNSHILVRSRFLAWGLPPSVSSHGKDNVLVSLSLLVRAPALSDQGPTLWNSFNLNHSLKALSAIYNHIERLRLQHLNWEEGRDSCYSSVCPTLYTFSLHGLHCFTHISCITHNGIPLCNRESLNR